MIALRTNQPIPFINFEKKEDKEEEKYNLITDVVMAQIGEAKGHGLHVDAEFIQAAASWFNENKPNGVKANWGHNWENIGRTVGKFHNIRATETQLLGDLHLYNAADASPELPNITNYIREMSAEDPEALMCSLVFTGDHYYQKTSSGQHIKVYYYDEEDNWISSNPELGEIYIAWSSGRSCDLVGDGALTESLFSTETLADKLHNITNHPKFNEMMQQHGDNFTPLNEYYHKKSDNSILQKIKQFFKKETMEPTPQTPEIAITPEITAAAAPEAATTENKFEERFAELENKLNALAAEKLNLLEKISDMETQLSELPADTHTSAATTRNGAGEQTKQKSWMQDPINQIKLN